MKRGESVCILGVQGKLQAFGVFFPISPFDFVGAAGQGRGEEGGLDLHSVEQGFSQFWSSFPPLKHPSTGGEEEREEICFVFPPEVGAVQVCSRQNFSLIFSVIKPQFLQVLIRIFTGFYCNLIKVFQSIGRELQQGGSVDRFRFTGLKSIFRLTQVCSRSRI